MLLTNTRMGRIESDISVRKGGHVRTMLMDRLPDLAETLESNLIRTVPREELVRMARTISRRHSRRPTQVSAEPTGRPSCQGKTAATSPWKRLDRQQRDSDRAVRNAHLLTEASGVPAIPVIASVRTLGSH